MLQFFKRIRRKLINTGSLSFRSASLKKYLIYAIGEIALVVIGILIALQINNWNEWKKERIKEREILIDLVENLEINIETIAADITILQALGKSSEIVLSSIHNKLPYVDSLAPHFHLARVPKNELFLSRTGYEEYKDIGLQILTNKDLKDEVLNLFESIYPRFFADYNQVNGYLPAFDDHVVQNFIYTDGRLEPVDYQKILTDNYYISWIRAYKEGRKYLIKIENNLSVETQRVLQLLQDELK